MPQTPKCSLLVLTYNQERFVGAAVDAALAQTGAPLEIIVSDDASTDATFDILSDRVARYDGPHEVILRRNKTNMGVIPHTNLVVGLSAGDILIPCYGDDVSFPDRAAKVLETFERYAPMLTHSHAISIDENDRVVGSTYPSAAFFRSTDALQTAVSLSVYLGASGAWSRELFEKYGPINSPLVFDDLVLGFRAALEGRIHLIEEPLLYYREGIGISPMKLPKKRSRAENRAWREKVLRRSSAVFEQRLADARRFGLPDENPIVKLLNKTLRRDRVRLACYENWGRVLSEVSRHPGSALEALASEMLHDIRKR